MRRVTTSHPIPGGEWPYHLAFAANKRVVATSKDAGMSDPLKRKLRKKAKKAQRRVVEKALEANGRHSREKKRQD
jgi:hypothetical protein